MLTRELVTVEPGAVISSVQGSVQGRASFIASVVIMVLMEYCVSSAEDGRDRHEKLREVQKELKDE